MTEVWLITGTDTEVGKTIVTAAVAAAARVQGYAVAVIKPGQTGVGPGSTQRPDVDIVAALAEPDTVRTLATYPEPLGPLAAAEEAGEQPLGIGDVIEAVTLAAAKHDVVLIEGAGGLLVPMGEGRWTVADLAVALRCPAVVVARAGLGTINHTTLTFEALEHRAVRGFLVLGSWPADPDLVHWRNLVDLPGDLVGVLPEGAGALPAARFRDQAPHWLAPTLYGRAAPDGLRQDGVPGPPPPWPT